MVTAALLAFGVLAMAWLLAPTEARRPPADAAPDTALDRLVAGLEADLADAA